MTPTPHNAPEGYQWISHITHSIPGASVVELRALTSAGESVRLHFAAMGAGVWQGVILPEGEVVPPETGMLTVHPVPFDDGAEPAAGTRARTGATTRAGTPAMSRAMSPSDAGEESPFRAGSTSTASPNVAAASVTESSAGVTLATDTGTLRIARNPFTLSLMDRTERDIFRDNPGDVDGLGRPFVLPLGYARSAGNIPALSFSFHLDSDEHLFGLGEKFLPLNRRGQRIVSWTQDAFGSTSERSHKNIPLLISSRGYGLFLDTGARITWDLGTTSCQSCTVTVEAPSLRFFIVTGSSPAEILKKYADLTGYAPVPPRWTFGLWISSGGTYRDTAAMESLVNGLEKHQVPADVVHVDPWWMTWRKYCDFRWNADAFPDPEGYIGGLHEKGLRLCLWEHPYISVESDLFTAGQERGYFLRRPDGSVYIIDYGLSLAPRPDGIVREAAPDQSWNARVAIIDMSNPDAVRWFQDLHRPVLRMGADVFKTDFGEDIPRDALFHNGQTGASMHNLYPLLYNEAVAAVTRDERGHSAVWGRAATGGSQRTPVCWSGDPAADFDSLGCTIRGGLSMGLSGVPFWSNDIGGYRGMPDPELYVRWAQFGLFCSHSRMHGDSPREPWVFGENALRIVRSYVNLRYQFFPYFYSTAREASRTGMPVIRALALMWPDDPNALDKDQQYMLGPWLMVAPVVHRSGRKSVYLPEGVWIDYWTGEQLNGPRTLHLRVPLDRLPLYVREGAIIPSMRSAMRIPEGRIDPLLLDLYPSSTGSASYTIREDEGNTDVTVTGGAGGMTVQWSGPVRRRFLLRVHVPEARGMRVVEKETDAAEEGSLLIQVSNDMA